MTDHKNEGAYNSSKDNEILMVYEYLQNNTATATMVAVDLNIYRPSLCRYKRRLERQGLLAETRKDYCAITRRKASYLTTNSSLMPFNNQLKLF
jgi:Mn-dependent DtxR family transcriptional regulator